MTTLPDWLSAARADAVAAQRADGWLTVPEMERAGHDPHDADHIARFSPDVALLALGVVEAAGMLHEPLFTNPYQDQECVYCGEEMNLLGYTTHHPTCEWFIARIALEDLRAHVEGTGE